MNNTALIKHFEFLHNSSSIEKVKSQKKAVDLLLEKYQSNGKDHHPQESDTLFLKISSLLSDASQVFYPKPIQKEVYHSDSGTAAVPKGIQKTLLNVNTEVASLKFHLIAEELEYPDWALFESFSPTTGNDLALMPEEIRNHLEDVQRVEFASSPDGPYQYLCLRHHPEKRLTERVDLKDPADLRPGTSAFWIDQNLKEKRAFSIIASEEQAAQRLIDLMDSEGLIDGAAADQVMVTNGMISRYSYDSS